MPKLNAPTKMVWQVALVLLVLGVIGVILALAKVWNPPTLMTISALVGILGGAVLAVATATKRL
jgi:CHASE2 domain-containing sensor protein